MKYESPAVKLCAAIYAPTDKEIRDTLHDEGFPCSTAEIIHGPAPLYERVMVVPTAEAVYVVFRGTQNKPQWRSNCNPMKVPVPSLGHYVRVHSGFFRGLEDVLIPLLDALEPWRNKKLIITGHSRGGAEAVLAAQILAGEKFKIEEIHTFGTPRSLNAKAAQASDLRFDGQMWRWVANNDTVCRVPFRWMGYRHTGDEMYFDALDHQYLNPSMFRKLRGQIRGRRRGGLFDGLSDHDAASEYRRLIA